MNFDFTIRIIFIVITEFRVKVFRLVQFFWLEIEFSFGYLPNEIDSLLFFSFCEITFLVLVPGVDFVFLKTEPIAVMTGMEVAEFIGGFPCNLTIGEFLVNHFFEPSGRAPSVSDGETNFILIVSKSLIMLRDNTPLFRIGTTESSTLLIIRIECAAKSDTKSTNSFIVISIAKCGIEITEPELTETVLMPRIVKARIHSITEPLDTFLRPTQNPVLHTPVRH